MPEIIHYTITQTRTVDVTANNVSDAVQIAEAAFEHGQNSDNGIIIKYGKAPAGIYGNTTTRIKEIMLEIKRKG